MSSKTAIVYSQNHCAACITAKSILELNGYQVEERNISKSTDYKSELFTKVPGARSVPHIFIGDKHFANAAALREWFNVATTKGLVTK